MENDIKPRESRYKKYYWEHRERRIKENRDWKKLNKERVKEYNYEWKKNNNLKIRKYINLYMKTYIKNPLKFRARKLALKYIKIPIGYLCEICNIKLAVERHHQDYSKPLEVNLICKDCHLKLKNAKRNKNY